MENENEEQSILTNEPIDEPTEEPIQTPEGNITEEDLTFTDIPYDARRKIDNATIKNLMTFPLTPSSAPTNDYDVANKKYVDDAATIAFPNTEVFDGNAPATYTDLDLSAVVGANSAIAYLKVQDNDGSGSDVYHFRQNGETNSVGVPVTFAIGGITTCDVCADGSIQYVLVATDTAGIIEWFSNNEHSTKITVVAYIK